MPPQALRVLLLHVGATLLGATTLHAQDERPAAGNAASPEAPRGIVLILADDLGAECLGSAGSAEYDTPNLDHLAARGLRFTHAHSQPLCTPTRVELLTGQSNARNYVAFSILPPDSRTFAHAVREHGFATGVFGKWQLLGAEHYPERLRLTGSTPRQAGFEQSALWQVEVLGSRYHGPRITYDGGSRAEPQTIQHDAAAYGPDLFTDELIEFLRVQSQAQSRFLAYYPMALTHDPFVPAPTTKPADAGDGSGRATTKPGPEHFASMVQHMDHCVGRIRTALDDLHLTEHTLLIFVGDNGTHPKIRSRMQDGSIIQGGKRSTRLAATHVPLILSWPGTIDPAVDDRLVHVRDLHRTILDLTGSDVPEAVRADTVSLAPRILGDPEAPRRDHIAFWYHPRPVTRKQSRPITFAMDERYKLYGDGRLFDLRADPLESAELTPELLAETRTRLQRALDGIPARATDR